MLRIYHSNQLDLLKTLIATIIERQPLSSPFSKEVILVQSEGMAHWLQMQLADYFSIAANIDFPLPATFIWHIFTQVLEDIPQESAFSKSAMTWSLMALLPEMLNKPTLKPLHHYLSDQNDPRKLFQLARRIADLFDHYLVYRPQWLQQWHQGRYVKDLDDNQQWQAELWSALENTIRLNGQSPWHRANLYHKVIEKLNQSDKKIASLPERIFICGITSLPPMYLQILQALGRHIDIHLMFTNPCRYYWGDIQDYAFLSQLQARRRLILKTPMTNKLFRQPDKVESLFNSQGEQFITNPLLASWGKQGRDNLYLLAQLNDFQEIDAFVNINADNLLHRIQRDILELEDHSLIGDRPETLLTSEKKRILAPDDNSVEINACHSPQREVEVLHDRLLALLETHPDLECRDIIVMVADIDRYVPYIQAVFANAPADRYLPFVISDRRAKDVHPVIQAFLTLLDLPQSRFSAENITGLLDVPALAARFAIDEGGLLILRQWIEGAGIRWGLDDEMQTELALPVTGQNTWQFGLTRMLLGYAMNSNSGEWDGILPFDQSSGLIAELAGQLAGLLQNLSIWRKRLQENYTLDEWLPLCRQLIDDFFETTSETEAVLALIERHWQHMINYGVNAGYRGTVSITLLRDELMLCLDNQRVSQRFLAGPINFCTLMPMRSIPFNVVCLLGMNDGVYPRIIQPSAFDLIAKKPQRGDRSRRDDDRYLFLEALLSAQKQLYISYIGRSLYDNSERFPSILVSELIDYIVQSHVLPGDEQKDIDSSAIAVRNHLIKNYPRTPYSPQNFTDGRHHALSYMKEWLPAARYQQKKSPDFCVALPDIEIHSLWLDELRRFYRHPVRYFFRQRLHVYFNYDVTELADQEPFNLNGLQRYQINDQLLNHLIEGEPAEPLFRRLRGAGELPYGAFGDIFWTEQVKEMSLLAQQILQEKHSAESQSVSLQLDGCLLQGQLHQVQDDGVLRWRAAKLTIADAMMLWLDHLVYVASGGKGQSRMYGRSQSKLCFSPLTVNQAYNELNKLIQGYRSGMNKPMLFLPHSGWAWLTRCYQKENQQINMQTEIQTKAKQDLLNTLLGDQRFPGEVNDPYLNRLFISPGEQQIKSIIDAALCYLLPLRQQLIDN